MSDDHTVVVTLEYHAMAENAAEAIQRVVSNLNVESGSGDLLPMCMTIEVDQMFSRGDSQEGGRTVRLMIRIDEVPYQIDTTDPELLAKWVLEIFGRMPYWTPATYVTMQAYPSSLPDGKGGYSFDWATDSRIMGSIKTLDSPRDLVKKLGEFLDEAEALKS